MSGADATLLGSLLRLLLPPASAKSIAPRWAAAPAMRTPRVLLRNSPMFAEHAQRRDHELHRAAVRPQWRA